MESWKFLLEIVLLLGACLVLGGICSRLRQSPLIGYLLAGMLLGGPGSLHVVHSEGSIEAIAELGVALLLFSLGLEFSWSHFVEMGPRAIWTGILQVVSTTLIAAGVVLALGLGFRSAIVIGGMISLSSTAAVMRVFADRREHDSQRARKALAILLVQDMAVVPLAILVDLATSTGTASAVALKLAKTFGVAVGLIVVLYVLLHHVAMRMLRSLSAVHNRELIVLLAVVTGLGSTWGAHAAGLSPALGAFIAGMFLGGSPFAAQIRADISSLRIVLLTLFFGAVGMVADGPWMLAHPGLVLATALAIIIGKTIITTLCVNLFEPSKSTSLSTGLSLAQVGEFAFVIGGTARASGILEDEAYRALVSGTMFTLFVTPYLISLSDWTVRRLNRATSEPQETPAEAEVSPRLLLIGFGPAGQAVGRALLGRACHTYVLDVNPGVEQSAAAFGMQGLIGDATQWDVLDHAGVRDAAMVIVTLPDIAAATTVVDHARRLAPSARIIVRSRYERNEPSLAATGAHAVIGDERQVGQALAESVRTNLKEIKQAWQRDGHALLESTLGP